MKCRIFKEKNLKKEVYFKLIEAHDNGIRLVACDSNGRIVTHGNIIEITNKGTLYFHYHINKEIGFKLTTEGKIKIEGENYEKM